jgi:hypothetical protein
MEVLNRVKAWAGGLAEVGISIAALMFWVLVQSHLFQQQAL